MNRRFKIEFQPSKTAQAGGLKARTATVYGAGWKDALNQSDAKFDLAHVRFLTHPSGRGLGTAYDSDGRIVGQVVAKAVR